METSQTDTIDFSSQTEDWGAGVYVCGWVGVGAGLGGYLGVSSLY